MNFNKAVFLRSAVKEADFPMDALPQIAFAGKSNVGKSSTINKILNRKNFARVGNEPGKTVHINFFCIDQQAYFVDLPGYGYAKVSKKEKERWGKLLEAYFASGSISLGIQIVDIRHKPTADDVTMANWFRESGVSYFILANKSDKLKKSQIAGQIQLIRETLLLPEIVEVIPFSAANGENREWIIQRITTVAEAK